MAEDQIDQMARSLRNIERYFALQKQKEATKEEAPRYFSTGPDGVLVQDPEFDKITFGFNAEKVNVRTDEDIEVAFRRPTNQADWIPLPVGNSPLEMDSERFEAEEIYVRPADRSANTPRIRVVAY